MTRSSCEDEVEDLRTLTEAELLKRIAHELAEKQALLGEYHEFLSRWEEEQRLARLAREREIRVVVSRGWWRSPLVLSVRDP